MYIITGGFGKSWSIFILSKDVEGWRDPESGW
jgi:hypothetical protein